MTFIQYEYVYKPLKTPPLAFTKPFDQASAEWTRAQDLEAVGPLLKA